MRERGEIYDALRKCGYPPGVAADVLIDFRKTILAGDEEVVALRQRAESAEAQLAEAKKKIKDFSSSLLNAAADKLDGLPAGGEALSGPQWYRQGVSDAANCLRDWADAGAIKVDPPPGDTP